MIMLGSVVDGRANNLNLIRMVAAMAVLVSHAWPLTQGPATIEPLQLSVGYSLGTIAVHVFFALSGFLITASYLRNPDPVRFVCRRIRRLVPGLAICLTLTVFVLGPAVTSLQIADYFSAYRTWQFLFQNAAMLGLVPGLPGVFAQNPFPAVAGSIWTLSYEVMCYSGVLAVGMTGLLTNRWVAVLLASAITVANIVSSGVELHPRLAMLLSLSLPFSVGAAVYLWRARIPLATPPFAMLLAATFLAMDTIVYDAFLAVTICYAVVLIGYHPVLAAAIPRDFGDYSYGLYLYAFPVQGLVVLVSGPMPPWLNILLALPLSLLLAVLSWHLVEKPCLARNPKIRWTKAGAHEGIS